MLENAAPTYRQAVADQRLPEREGTALRRLLERALVGEAAHVAVMAIDPERFLHEAGPAARAHGVSPKIALAGRKEAKPLAMMHAAATPEARSEIVLAYVRKQLAHVLGINEAAFDIDMPLSDLGLDSLMAVQLRNRVEADLPLKVSLEKLLGGQSAIELAEILDDQLRDSGGSPDPNREEIVI
jgi:acyl carrier protein